MVDEINIEQLVRDFIEAANRLRGIADIEIGLVMVDLMQEMPIKTSYALLVPERIYAQQVKDRLPEGAL